MRRKQILFVEDKISQQRSFRTAVKEWNEDHRGQEQEFVVTIVPRYSEAKEALSATPYDCALFDLHLPPESGGWAEEASGNALARIGLVEKGIPVAVISALPEDLDEELRQFRMVKAFDKREENPYRDAIDWFGKHWRMMDVLKSARDKIQGSAAEVFAKRVWPRWEKWSELAGGEEDLSGIVTRQYVNHIAELLGTEGSGIDWHPFENYVSPSFLEDRAHTGDLFEIDGDLWIVMSPPCDMANRKIENVLLALCDRDGIDKWDENIKKLQEAKNAEQILSRSGFFNRYSRQNIEASSHFLPPLLEDPRPIMVDFNRLTTKPLAELNEMLERRVAAISAPFLSNLIQRFGAYVSRMGQPNIGAQLFLRS